MSSGRRMENTAHYMVVQGLDWAAFAVIWVYIVVILRSYGMSYGQAGMITALSNILAVAVQQRLSGWADRRGGDSSRRAAVGLMALGSGSAFFLLLLRPVRLWLVGGCFCVIGITIMGVQPFLNTIAMEQIRCGRPLNYGLARGMGSISYAAASALASLLIGPFGTAGLLAAYVVINLLGILSVALFSNPGMAPRKAEAVIGSAALLKRNRIFACFLAASVLLYTAHMLETTYTDAIVRRAGGSGGELGLAAAVGAAAELPAMALLQNIRKRFSTRQILLFSAASFLLKLLCLSTAVTMEWVYLAKLLQFAEYGLFTPMSVYYVSEWIELENQAKGQALCAGASTLGAVLGNCLGGVMIDRAGVRNTMLAGAALSAVGLLLLIRCVPRENKV